MLSEFKTFLTKSNALALAVGVIIGAAVGKVVSSLVESILMPLISFIMPDGDWRTAKWVLRTVVQDGKTSETAIGYGQFIGAVVDFIIIAFVVFIITKALLKPEPVADVKTCPECLESVPSAAKKCRACGSVFE